jgi:hypothetical protein
MRSIVAAVVLAACSLRSRTAFADLPTPQVEGVTSTGFAYVGTVNPTTVPMSALPPIDLAPVVVTQTDGPGGAKDVEIHGGTLDVVHFGPGLSQLFTGTASMEAFMHAEIGSIHLLASADAASTPLDYQAPFPGALGDNPFFGEAVVSIGAGFVDIVTIPATKAAPNAGNLTTVTLNVVAECSSPIQVDDDSDLRGNISGSLSLSDGTDLGGIATTDPPGFSSSPGCPFGASRPLSNVPVLTPIALHFSLAVALSAKTGIDLQGRVHQGSYGVDHAFINLLNTGAVMLTNAEGAGARGSTGHDYGTLNGGPTISTTTSTTTTSTFIPPTTLPSCTGYCGDGIVQTDCAEACDCPTVDAMAVAVCAAGTATPALVPDCARCAGCAVDLSQCATPSTTTVPGATTTTTTPVVTSTTTATTAPGATATTSTLACETTGCLLDAALHAGACGGEAVPPHITRALDRVLHLIDEAHVSSPRKAKRLLREDKHLLGIATRGARKAARGKKPRLTSDCARAIEHAVDLVRAGLGG